MKTNNIIISCFDYTDAAFLTIGVGSSSAALTPALQAFLFIGSVFDNPLSMMSVLTHSFQDFGGLPRFCCLQGDPVQYGCTLLHGGHVHAI